MAAERTSAFFVSDIEDRDASSAALVKTLRHVLQGEGI
jgi:hypothetical protein